MREADARNGWARWAWALVPIQLLLVAAYGYAAVAYLNTDADYFPEQSPPGWAWPAVIVVGIGFVPALICLALSVPTLASEQLRANRGRWAGLLAAAVLASLMLLVMATPPGWVLFDWYVS